MQNRSLLTLTVLLAAAAGPAAAQVDWVALDPTAPKGTPAELRFLPASSSAQTSTFELEIYGYWSEPVVGPDNVTYRRLTFPGLGEVGQVGAPELPALRTRLAVATDAASAVLAGVTVDPGDLHMTSMTIYPMPMPALDGGDPGPGDENGQDEQFQKDAAIYGTDALFPAASASASAKIGLLLDAIPTAEVELHPVRYNPVQKRLEVAGLTTYAYRHDGAIAPPPPMTLDKLAVGAASCPNWPTADDWLVANTATYSGRYLIVTPEAYLDALEPFVEHRKSTGFAVTVITLESLPFVSCGEIRSAIDAWYQLGAPGFDHYCLLVGDEWAIPHCPSATPELIPGDDRYGSPAGVGDLDEEVFVGRLAVNNAADLAHQTAKIIAYELDDDATHDYADAILTAHLEGAPEKYVGAHEAVANAPYTVPPDFEKFYGSDPLTANTSVLAAIEQGAGLVAYRGHGTTNTWSEWNVFGEYFHKDDVATLTNEQLPVVWSLSCTNNNITNIDGIGETWLQAAAGAVAHYGSTIASGTTKNHTLDKKLFEAVFRHGITTHGQAIAWAEDETRLAHANNTWQNEWMYMLLGCPAMKIRRSKPNGLDLVLPPTVPACTDGVNCPIVAQVVDGAGNPVEGVLVTAYKPSFPPGGPDELFFTGYTGTGGTVVVPGPTELGAINWTGRDDDGNVAKEVTTVQKGAFVDLGDALAGAAGKPALASGSSLQGGTPVTLTLANAAPNSVGLMAIGFVDSALPLFGGIVHPVPSAVDVPIATNALGAWTYTVPAWPAGLAPGMQLYWQAGIVDFGAVEDIALSNALRSTQP